MANQITVSSYWHNKTLNEKKKSIHTTHKIIASPEHTWRRKENCYCVPSRIKIKTSLTCICGLQITQRNCTTIEKTIPLFNQWPVSPKEKINTVTFCSSQNLVCGSQEIRRGNTSGDWTPENKVVTPQRAICTSSPTGAGAWGIPGQENGAKNEHKQECLALFSILPPFYRQWLGKLRIPVNKRRLIGIITWQIQ